MITRLPRPSARVLAIVIAVVLFGACDARPTELVEERGVCPQTYEFGNAGCAAVVAALEEPAPPWPALYRVELTARPAGDVPGLGGASSPASSLNPLPLGPVSVRVTLWSGPLLSGADTASMWIVARMLDMSLPIIGGPPLPTFAADSVLRVVRFVPVGARYPADTVRLTLRRPAG
jgi:hypothetical protein